MTTLCSWRLCPMPGMYAVTSTPLVRRTRATFRRAEFGFFGVWVRTTRQTPRFCGFPIMAGDFDFFSTFFRPLRTSWLIVGISCFLLLPRYDRTEITRRAANGNGRRMKKPRAFGSLQPYAGQVGLPSLGAVRPGGTRPRP